MTGARWAHNAGALLLVFVTTLPDKKNKMGGSSLESDLRYVYSFTITKMLAHAKRRSGCDGCRSRLRFLKSVRVWKLAECQFLR